MPPTPAAPSAVARPWRWRAFALMTGGALLLTGMDGIIKLLTTRYPVPETAFFRCLMALPFLLVAVRVEGGIAAVSRARPGPQLLRGLLATVTALTFFGALRVMPLADALAIGFAAPFLVAALSGRLLGEPVDRAQWLAIAGGFVGVLVVLRPGAGMLHEGALLAITSAIFYALAQLALRKVGMTDPASVTALWSTGVPLIINGLIAAPFWVTPAGADLWLMLAVGVLGAAGSLMISAAFKLAPAATLSPFEYSAIVWAVLIDAVVFGHSPGGAVLVGSGIIIASGLALARGTRH